LEVIHPYVGNELLPACDASAAVVALRQLQNTQTRVDQSDITGSQQAARLMGVAYQRYNYTLEVGQAEMAYRRRQTSYEQSLRSLGAATGNAAGVGEGATANSGDALTDMLETFMTASQAYAHVHNAQREIYAQQAVVYRGLFQQGQETARLLNEHVPAAQRLASAGREFTQSTLDRMERVSRDVQPAVVNAPSSLRRLCTRASDVEDRFVFQMATHNRGRVVAYELKYDRGPTQRGIARNVEGSSQWVGQFHWPTGATSATVRLRTLVGGSWEDLAGFLTPGRVSLDGLRERTAAMARRLRSELGHTEYAAKGGYMVRTMIIW
jgi:hypothetical protein